MYHREEEEIARYSGNPNDYLVVRCHDDYRDNYCEVQVAREDGEVASGYIGAFWGFQATKRAKAKARAAALAEKSAGAIKRAGKYLGILALLTLVIGLSGCVDSPLIDSALYSRVQAFKVIYGVDVDYDVVFGETRKDYWSGQCMNKERLNPLKKKVIINEEYWKGASREEKHWVIHHELAHCSCGVGHFSKTFEDGTPVSIMHPGDTEVVAEALLEEKYRYYHEELAARMEDDGYCDPNPVWERKEK